MTVFRWSPSIPRATGGGVRRSPRGGPGWLQRWAPWLLAGAAAGLYLGTLGFDFVWDDLSLILFNQYVHRLRDLPSWIRLTVDEASFGAFSGSLYRPGVLLSLALDFALWGERPAGFHLTNILLHGVAVFLVYRLVRAVARRDDLAAVSAALFAVFPTHVEPVAWISARADLWIAICLMSAALLYLRSQALRGWRRGLAYAGAAGAMLLGFGFKESAAVFPALVLLLEVAVPRCHGTPAHSWPGILLRALPFWALAIAHLLFLSRPLQSYNPPGLSGQYLLDRLPGSLETLARYAGLLAAPLHMHPYYELPRPDSLLHGWSLAGLGVLVGLLAAAAAAWRRSPVSAFGLGWFLLAVAPYLDLLAISPRPMGLADRYLYVPSIGVLLVLGDLLRRGVDLVSPRLSGAWRAPLLALATGVLAIGYGGIVAWYLPVWEDNVHLYARMIRDFPTASQPRMNLGTALLDRGEIDQGIRELEAAVRLRPDLVRPQINLAFATARRDPQAAFRVFDRVAPAAVDDLAYYLMRSHAHLGARQPADAADVLAAGLARFPESAELHMLLGRAREAQRNLPDALASYRHAAARFPHLPGALEGLGRVLAQLGDLEGAGVALVQARELRPNHLPTLRLLALLREAQGRQEESRRLWCELAQRSGDPGVIAEADARAARMPGGTGCRRP